MSYRAFIAIPISKELQEEIQKIEERWRHLPFRWTAPETIHLTLVFLGNISDGVLRRAQEILQKVGEQHHKFSIEFTELVYGPRNRPPRMIWLHGLLSQELQRLVNDLERELSQDASIRYRSSRPFREVHLTLARRKERSEQSSLPRLPEAVSFLLPVQTLQLITSELRPEGPRYTVVKETVLKI